MAARARAAPEDDPDFVRELVGQAQRPSVEEEIEEALIGKRPACAATTLGLLIKTVKNGDSNTSAKLAARLVVELTQEDKERLARAVQGVSFAALDVPSSQSACLAALQQVLPQVRRVDLVKLIALCERNRAASAVMRGKDCVVLLGPTGVGKSLATHFLLGSKLERQRVDGIAHIGVRKAAPGAESIVTSQLNRSETAAVTGHRLPLPGGAADELLLCDTPGTSDNRGCEVLISVGLTSVQALQQARTVRPVVMVSYKSLSEQRGVALVEFLKHLAPMCGDLQATVTRTFFYLFTKCDDQPPSGAFDFASLVRNVFSGLSEPLLRTNVAALLLDMFVKVGGRIVFDASDQLETKRMQFVGTYSEQTLSLQHVDANGRLVPVPGNFAVLNKPAARLQGVGLLLTPEELTTGPAAALFAAAKLHLDFTWRSAAVLRPLPARSGPATDRNALLQQLSDKDATITSPASYFRPFVPERPLVDLFEQLSMTAEDARIASARLDFSGAAFHLNVIKQLDALAGGQLAGPPNLGFGAKDLDPMRYHARAVKSIEDQFAQLKAARLQPLLLQWERDHDMTGTSLSDWTLLQPTLNAAAAALSSHVPSTVNMSADWFALLIQQQQNLCDRVLSYLSVDDNQVADPTAHVRVAADLRAYLTKLRLAATQLGVRHQVDAAEDHVVGLLRAVQERALTALKRLQALFLSTTAIEAQADQQASDDLLIVERALQVLLLYGGTDAGGLTTMSIAVRRANNELKNPLCGHISAVADQTLHALAPPAVATLPSQLAYVRFRVQYLNKAVALPQLAKTGDLNHTLQRVSTALGDSYVRSADELVRQTGSVATPAAVNAQLARGQELVHALCNFKEAFPTCAASNPERFDRAILAFAAFVNDNVFNPLRETLKMLTAPHRPAAGPAKTMTSTAVATLIASLQQLEQLRWLDAFQSGLVASALGDAHSVLLGFAGGLVNRCHDALTTPLSTLASLASIVPLLQDLQSLSPLVACVPALRDVVSAGIEQVHTRIINDMASLVRSRDDSDAAKQADSSWNEDTIASTLATLARCANTEFPPSSHDPATFARAELGRYVGQVRSHFAALTARSDAAFETLHGFFGNALRSTDTDDLTALVEQLILPLKCTLACLRAIGSAAVRPADCGSLDADLTKLLAQRCSPAEPGTWVLFTNQWSDLPREPALIQQRLTVLQALLPLDTYISPALELMRINLASYRNYRTFRELYDLHRAQRDKDESQAIVAIADALRSGAYAQAHQLASSLVQPDLRAKAASLVHEHVATTIKVNASVPEALTSHNDAELKALGAALQTCLSRRAMLTDLCNLEPLLDAQRATALHHQIESFDKAIIGALVAVLAPVPALVAPDSNKFADAETRMATFGHAQQLVLRAGIPGHESPLQDALRGARACIAGSLSTLTSQFAASKASAFATTADTATSASASLSGAMTSAPPSLLAVISRPSRLVARAAADLHNGMLAAENILKALPASDQAILAQYRGAEEAIAAYLLAYLQSLLRGIEECDLSEQPTRELAAQALVADLAISATLGLQADALYKDFLLSLENGLKKRRAEFLKLLSQNPMLDVALEHYKEPRLRSDREGARAMADFLKSLSAARLEAVSTLLRQATHRSKAIVDACQAVAALRADADKLHGFPEQALFASQAAAAQALVVEAFNYSLAALQHFFSSSAATSSPAETLLEDFAVVDSVLAARMAPESAAPLLTAALDAVVAFVARFASALPAALTDVALIAQLGPLLNALSASQPFLSAIKTLVANRRAPPAWSCKADLDPSSATLLATLESAITAMNDEASASLLAKARELDRNSPQQAAFVARLHAAVTCLDAARAELVVQRAHLDTSRLAALAAAGSAAFASSLAAANDRAMTLVGKPALDADECTELIKIYNILHVLGANGQERAAAVTRAISKGLTEWATKHCSQLSGMVSAATAGHATMDKNAADSIANGLVHLQNRKVYLVDFQKEHFLAVGSLLKAVAEREGGDAAIEMLHAALTDDKAPFAVTGMGRKLIAEHDVFEDFERRQRTVETQRFTVDKVVEAVRAADATITETQADKLLSAYRQYETSYWALITEVDKPDGSLDVLTLRIRRLGEELSREVGTCDKTKLCQLLSLIFAYWTLLNTGKYVGAKKRQAVRQGTLFYLQPHAAQVVCILRLLALDRDADKPATAWVHRAAGDIAALSGHMAQVPTGEGKSIVLAALAMVFALLGFAVDCACYSEYLSRRDFDDFALMFTALGILDRISYNTFQRLCEDLVNSTGSVRDMVRDVMVGGHGGAAAAAAPPPRAFQGCKGRVLLVDEVDVFLSKFIGSPYLMQTQLRDSDTRTILELISHVWRSRGTQGLSPQDVFASEAYRKCQMRFKDWDFVLQTAVVKMLAAVNSFQSPSYKVQGDRIGYVRQDTISFTHLEGYKTVFAYFHEAERGNVSAEARDSFASIFVTCGRFSYAEIPKQYALILGVTGTLRELSQAQRDMLQNDYAVKHFTFLPSVYSKGLTYDVSKHFAVVPAEKHFDAILTSLLSLCSVTFQGTDYKRPLIVVFDTNEELQQFRQRESFKAAFKAARVNLLTEDLSPSDKASVVSQATTLNTITLITRNFGRGTNFMSYDRNLGGVHVLQTFFPDDLAEEVQIKGRTARQGYPGSYSVIMADGPLIARFPALSKATLLNEAPDRLYAKLDQLRTTEFETAYKERLTNVDSLKTSHDRTVKFVASLVARDTTACREVLREWNTLAIASGPPPAPRTLVLLDGTISMGGTLNNSKKAVQLMFNRAKQIITEAKANVTFEMQIAIFRNYGSGPSELLECSPWSSDAATLERFLEPITVKGGEGNEAMEIGFWHANQQAAQPGGLSQIIVLGDAMPNNENDVQSKRRRTDWSATPYAVPTHYRREIEQLKSANVLVHAFYVVPKQSLLFKHDTMAAFETIAKLTGGTSASLDVNSASTQSLELLTSTVTKRILESAGGRELAARYDLTKFTNDSNGNIG